VGTLLGVWYSADGRQVVTLDFNFLTVVWDAETSEHLKVFPPGDWPGIPAGNQSAPLRAMRRGQETIIQRAHGDQSIAWFPIPLNSITSHPNGDTWAGVCDDRLYIITLKGAPDLEPHADGAHNEKKNNRTRRAGGGVCGQ
jgi:hypothetical protein